MIDVIEKVEQKLLTENVKWQNNLGLEEDEFCDGDKVKKYALTLAPITLPCSNPFSMAWYNDTLICCALNGYTYLKIGESFKMIKVLSVLGRTIFSDIILQGQKYPLVIDGTKKAYKLDNNQLVEIGHIDADYVCNNGETLFYGKGRKVTFSTVNDMTDFVFAIDRAGQIIPLLSLAY